MGLMGLNDKKGVRGRVGRARVWGRARVRAGLAVLAACAVASGCASSDGSGGSRGSSDSGGSHASGGGGGSAGSPAAGPAAVPGQQPPKGPPARSLNSYEGKLLAAQAARAAAAKKWGLDAPPLAAPPAPAEKPLIKPRKGFEVHGQDELDLPPVFTTVPTKDKVVFLTIDDGSNKDPAFLRMMSDLKIPYTAFLTNESVEDDYGYFRKMQARGITLNNHTLTHPYLPGLSYEGQKREICGMQDIMEEQFGERPLLMRPPFGNFNQDTLRAAKACGIEYAPIWNEEAFVDHFEWREEDKQLRPGDIILTHFRGPDEWKGTMPDMVRRLMKYVTSKGYAVAKLEDYL
ncbi:polysaccharide deacetylase family protein [Streptomyces sp. NPDC046821]|uniref:polysaccharide deacetylase family protein n=1 Tax=Streptomyces sp. NPDC046821 TaxID=3154702 RepID=UPI0033E73E89